MKTYTNGFTLIEVSITAVLLALVVSAVYTFWNYVQKSYQFTLTQYDLTDRAAQTVRRIATEVRQAEEAMDGAYPVAIFDDNQLAFYTDTNGDGKIERRRYFLDGTILKRGVVEPTGNPPSYSIDSEQIVILVDNIDLAKLPLFIYYNGNWPNDTVNNPLILSKRPLEAKLIQITIPLASSISQQSQTYVPSTLVQIRNLKNNW